MANTNFGLSRGCRDRKSGPGLLCGERERSERRVLAVLTRELRQAQLRRGRARREPADEARRVFFSVFVSKCLCDESLFFQETRRGERGG